MKKITTAIVLLICLSMQSPSKPQIKVFNNKEKSLITYAMSHPLHSWIAENKDITSVILCDEQKQTITQVAVSAKVASFDSQNANRDSPAIEVTEALKYPSITFQSTSIEQKGDKLIVIGTLSFHGVSKKKTFEAMRKQINDEVEVTGSFTVTMTEFGIEPPSLMGIATEDQIDITFDIFY